MIKRLILLVTSSFILAACGSDRYSGELVMESGEESITIQTAEGPVQFEEGPMNIKLDVQTGRFQTKAYIQLKQKQMLEGQRRASNVKAKIQFETLNHKLTNRDFEVPSSMSGQDFIMAGELDTYAHRTWDTTGTVSCTYSGYCYTCTPGPFDDPDDSCGYKYSYSCSGRQAADFRNHSYTEQFTLEFLSTNSSERFAYFQSSPKGRSTREVIRRYGRCR